MTTLLLCEAPLRDLTYRACMLEAAQAVPHEPPMLLATPAEGAPPGFRPVPVGPLPPGVKEVVLAGPYLDRGRFERALATAIAAREAGARVRVHNLALEGSAAQVAPPAGLSILERAGTLGLRDHRTADVLATWSVGAPIRVLGYPEQRLQADDTLAAELPPGRILGLAIRGGEEARRTLRQRLPAIVRLLSFAVGWPVLPLPTRTPGAPPDDDHEATLEVAAALEATTVLLPGLANPVAWRRRLTPGRYKALVARCRVVATNRDLPAAFAVACGVPVLGLALGSDKRIAACLATLANELPPGSALVHPAPDAA